MPEWTTDFPFQVWSARIRKNPETGGVSFTDIGFRDDREIGGDVVSLAHPHLVVDAMLKMAKMEGK